MNLGSFVADMVYLPDLMIPQIITLFPMNVFIIGP